MSFKKTVVLFSGSWVLGITLLHCWLNLGLFKKAETTGKTFKVGFLPVT
jgi:hypothetical protein